MADKDHEDMHASILRHFEEDMEADHDNREAALDDIRFRVGDSVNNYQWDSAVLAEREGRPCLTINRMPQFIRQVTNDAREARPSIKVRPVDDNADVDTAEVLEGLIRLIEDQCEAVSKAYIPAIDNAATCGMGAWRVKTGYADDRSFDQEVLIEGIPNALAVVWDHNAKDPTRTDAQHVFLIEDMSEDAFKAKYPKAIASSFQSGAPGGYHKDWVDGKTVRVAEYLCKEPVERTLAKMEDGKIIDVTDFTPEQRKFLPIKDTRKVDSHKIVQYIVSGAEILDGPNDLPGRYLPIIPVIGEEVWVGDTRTRSGLIRYAKAAQQLYNYWRSAMAEQVALQPKAPFVATGKQIEKYKGIWAQANSRNLPYLPYDPDGSAPPPQRQSPPQASTGISEEVMLAADEMKATTGIYDAALGNRSNETSGKAIQARKAESDVSTSHFGDNLALAIRHTGRVAIDLIPVIYDTERVVRILNEDGSHDHQPINQLVMTENGPEYMHDLSVGRYDVTVTTGPSYATKRMEAVDMMMQFIQTVPQSAQFVMDLIAKNMDHPGADEIAKRLRMQLRKTNPEMFDQDDKEQPPPPSPADQMNALAQQLDIQAKKAMTDKADADARLALAQAESSEMDASLKGIELASAGGAFQQAANTAVQNILMQMLSNQQGQQQQEQPQPQQQAAPMPNAAPESASAF